MDAAALLSTYTRAAVAQMARQRGRGSRDDNRETLVGLLASDLYDQERIEAALADLAPVERALLDRLVEQGGSAPTRRLRRELERAGKVKALPRPIGWGPPPEEKGSPWHRDSTDFADLVARLGVLGLAFTVG